LLIGLRVTGSSPEGPGFFSLFNLMLAGAILGVYIVALTLLARAEAKSDVPAEERLTLMALLFFPMLYHLLLPTMMPGFGVIGHKTIRCSRIRGLDTLILLLCGLDDSGYQADG